jgi:hypothetical protein
MKPSTDKYYQVKKLTIYNVITVVNREYAAFSKHPSVEYQLRRDDTQAPTMASDRLSFVTQAVTELQKSNAD